MHGVRRVDAAISLSRPLFHYPISPALCDNERRRRAARATVRAMRPAPTPFFLALLLLTSAPAGAETNAAEEAQYRAHALRTLLKDAAGS